MTFAENFAPPIEIPIHQPLPSAVASLLLNVEADHLSLLANQPSQKGCVMTIPHCRIYNGIAHRYHPTHEFVSKLQRLWNAVHSPTTLMITSRR